MQFNFADSETKWSYIILFCISSRQRAYVQTGTFALLIWKNILSFHDLVFYPKPQIFWLQIPQASALSARMDSLAQLCHGKAAVAHHPLCRLMECKEIALSYGEICSLDSTSTRRQQDRLVFKLRSSVSTLIQTQDNWNIVPLQKETSAAQLKCPYFSLITNVKGLLQI